MNQQRPLGAGGLMASDAMAILATAVVIWSSTELISSCLDAARLRNAVVVDAEILNVEVVHRNEIRDVVYYTYEYEYEGERYQQRTQRVAVFSRHSGPHEELQEAFRTGDTVRCYVDPEQPSLSVFSREFSLPWFLVSSLFPLAFGGVAILILAGLVRQRQRVKSYQAWRQT